METGQEIFRALGMSLIHSVWQGSIIATLVLFSLMVTGKSNAVARYRILYTGLMLLFGSFVSTFILTLRDNPVMLTLQYIDLQGNYERAVPASGGFVRQILSLIEPYSVYLAFGWLLGFMFMSVRMIGGAVSSRLLIRRNLAMPDENLVDLFHRIRNSMGLSTAIKLRISKSMISPLVTGIITPMVVIPAAAVTGLSPEQLRSVIVHELAHIRRYDHVLVLLQSLAQLVLFFHPLTWFLIRGIDRERENCCDDLVIRNNNNPLNYIKALAMIQEMNLTGSPANSLTGRSNQLLKRIRRLIKPETKHSTTFRLTVSLLFVLVFGISAMAFVIIEQPDIKTKSTQEIVAGSENESGLNGTISMFTGDDKDGDKKKKMVIVMNNDTITEMTVNGKKLSREEMKEYADDIRKIQRELENSQDELKLAQEELTDAHRELERAHKELELLHKDHNFNFHFDYDALKEFHEFDKLYHMTPDEFEKFKEFKYDFNELNEHIQNELNERNFHIEELKKAIEAIKEKNKELIESEEFRNYMDQLKENARQALEEIRESRNEELNDTLQELENELEE